MVFRSTVGFATIKDLKTAAPAPIRRNRKSPRMVDESFPSCRSSPSGVEPPAIAGASPRSLHWLPPALAIAGMHRSGTSYVASLFDGAGIKLGHNLVVSKDTPLCNAWLTLLRGIGVDAVRHGDSTGVIKELIT